MIVIQHYINGQGTGHLRAGRSRILRRRGFCRGRSRRIRFKFTGKGDIPVYVLGNCKEVASFAVSFDKFFRGIRTRGRAFRLIGNCEASLLDPETGLRIHDDLHCLAGNDLHGLSRLAQQQRTVFNRRITGDVHGGIKCRHRLSGQV